MDHKHDQTPAPWRVFPFAGTVLKNLFSKPATTGYPFEPAHYPERMRGHVEIKIEDCISQKINPVDLLASKNNRGDKKYVVRTDLYKQVAPMPVFKGEKNFNPHYMILKLSAKYRFLAVDAPLCIVDYQSDGMTANQFKQYIDSPNSYSELRRVIMGLPNVPKKYMLKTVIHYCSSSLISKNRQYIKESPKKLLTIMCTPLGWMLTTYIRRRAK